MPVREVVVAHPLVRGASHLVAPAALSSLLTDADRCEEMGRAAHERVRDHYLADRHLIQYVELFAQLRGEV